MPEGNNTRATDVENVDRLHELSGSNLRHATGLGWLAWTGDHWDDEDGEKRATHLATMVTESASRVSAMLKLAAADPRFAARVGDLDDTPGLVCTPGGVLDLRSFDPSNDGLDYFDSIVDLLVEIPVMKCDPVLMNTRVTGTKWVPDADMSWWEERLQASLPDPELRLFLQKALGYALVGFGSEKLLPILAGVANSGKSFIVKAVTDAFGTYATSLPGAALIERRGFGDDKGHELVALRGARLAIGSETSEDQVLNADLVKRLTAGGQETVTVRRLRQEWFSFSNRATIVLQTNSRPRVKDSSEGMWTRLRLVPFDRPIPEAERLSYTALMHDLSLNREAVLRWLVEGWLLYLDAGLEPPVAMKSAMDEYRSDEDWFSVFKSEIISVADTEAWVSADELYRAYLAWAAARCDRLPVSKNTFGRKAGVALTPWRKGRSGVRGYRAELIPGTALAPAPITAGQQAWADRRGVAS